MNGNEWQLVVCRERNLHRDQMKDATFELHSSDMPKWYPTNEYYLFFHILLINDTQRIKQKKKCQSICYAKAESNPKRKDTSGNLLWNQSPSHYFIHTMNLME